MSSGIDWLAVNFAVQGSTMTGLSSEERRMVVRRITFQPEFTTWPVPGTLTVDQVAARLGVVDRTIVRIKADLPEARKETCPVCGNEMWVYVEDGQVEEHPDSLMNECPLSGYWGYDDNDITALTARWLAGWFRVDMYGAATHINSLPADQARELLIAAVAAMPDKDPEELFGWMLTA